MRKKIAVPIHPFCLISFFFLHLWSHNVEKIFHYSNVTVIYLIALLIGLAFWSIALFFYRDIFRSAFLTSTVVTLFFLYGHLDGVLRTAFTPQPGYLIIFVCFVLIGALTVTLKRPGFAVHYYRYLNTFAMLLIIFPLINIASYSLQRDEVKALFQSFRKKPPQVRAVNYRPDVYFIILDAYARADVLKDKFGFDNGEFIDFLKETGFQVAEDSHSNYQHTLYSVASLMNMDYVDFRDKEMFYEAEYVDAKKLLIKRNRVAETFKALEYHYFVVDSGYGATSDSPFADHVYGREGWDFYRALLVKTTMLRFFKEQFYLNKVRKKILKQFDYLSKISKIQDPKFVFAHILAPHSPFVFDQNGKLPREYTNGEDLTSSQVQRKMYVDQLVYVNNLAKKAISDILKNAKKPPLIVLISDHGPEPVEDCKPDREYLCEQMGNLHAVYTPKDIKDFFYPGMTTVNVFRRLLDLYFDTELGLLEDKVYFDTFACEELDEDEDYLMSDSTREQIQFVDVTETLMQDPGLHQSEFSAEEMVGDRSE